MGSAEKRRHANQALLVLVPLAVLTGLFSNTIGVDWLIDPATIHGIVALSILLLTPWKQGSVRRCLGSGRRSRWNSMVLLALIATTLGSGLVHSSGWATRVGPLTIMQVHIGGALIALALVVAHYRSHPVRIRSVDVDRRAFLSAGGLLAAAVATWGSWEIIGARDRRFTGSHERGSFDPAAMPVTSWFDDPVQRIDGSEWSVRIDNAAWTLDDLAALPQDDLTAILDCTSGWYSEQIWTGVRLDQLIQADCRSIVVGSTSGYTRRFPTRDLENLWLVTHVSGARLSAGHGFPARVVAPGRRGFWWVKWVDSIETSDRRWWLQLPFPAT